MKNISPFSVTLEGQGENPEFEVLVPKTKVNEWEPLTFNFTSKIGQTVKGLGFLLDFAATRTSDGTICIDNISFYKGLTDVKSLSAHFNTIKYYPNPATNEINISTTSELSQVNIRNLLGQNIKSIVFSSLEKAIDLSDVSTGNYFVTVKLAKGEISTQKKL